MQPLNGKWIFEAECFQRRLQPFKNIYTCTRVFLRIWHFLFIPHCWWQQDDQSSAPSTNIQISKSINNCAKQCREDLGFILSADFPTSLKTNKETRHHLPAIEKKKRNIYKAVKIHCKYLSETLQEVFGHGYWLLSALTSIGSFSLHLIGLCIYCNIFLRKSFFGWISQSFSQSV